MGAADLQLLWRQHEGRVGHDRASWKHSWVQGATEMSPFQTSWVSELDGELTGALKDTPIRRSQS